MKMGWIAGGVAGQGVEYATVLVAAGAGACFLTAVVHMRVPYFPFLYTLCSPTTPKSHLQQACIFSS